MRLAHVAIIGALVLTVVLGLVQLQRGALNAGPLALPDPCTRVTAVAGDSMDERVQRVALRGLDIAACDLRTTREALLSQIATAIGDGSDLPADVEERLKAGLRQSVDREREAGGINDIAAFTLSQAIRFTPLSWLLRAVRELEPLLGGES